MKIRFTKNPAGKYRLAYEQGEIVSLPDLQAMEIVQDGYGELIEEYIAPIETAVSKVKTKKAVRR